MLNVASNPNVVSAMDAAPASPLSTVVNNATTANGQPVFAQIVRDVLNRTTSNGAGEGVSASKARDGSPAEPAVDASPAQGGSATKTPVATKQATKLQPQWSQSSPQSQKSVAPNELAILQGLITPSQAVSVPVANQTDQNADRSPAKTNAGDAQVPAAISTDSDGQALQASAQGDVEIQTSSQVQAQFSIIPLGLSPMGAEAGSKVPSSPVSASATSAASSTMVASAVDNTGENAARVAAQTSTIATKVEAGDSPAVPEQPQKAGMLAQVSNATSVSQPGQPLSSVLQQVTALEGASSGMASKASALVDVARTAVQEQVSEAAEKNALTSSLPAHTSAPSSTSASTDAKGTQSASPEAHPIDAAQNEAPVANNHSNSQDSAADHAGQNASDASVSSGSNSITPPAAKNEASVFSEALSAANMVKPDAAPAVPSASAAVAPVSTLPPPNEPSAGPAAAALPSAPAQAQEALPPLQTPDTPNGRFVNAAQLTNAASESEMRIAMQTDKLGTIELHARVSGGEVGAAIFVEKRDAHAALAVELPALQQALSEKQLRVGQVVLTQGSLSATAGDTGGNSQQNQRSGAQAAQSASFWNEARSLSTAAWFVPEQTGIFNAQGRLSVQA